MYKIALIDNKGNEFLGTTRCITTDGRYSLASVNEVVIEFISKLYDKEDIGGYNIYKHRFNSNVYKTVKL